MLKKIFSDSLIYAVGPQLPKLLGIFLLPVLTQYLTSEDYGIYGIAMAYIAGLSGLKELGFAQVLANYFYRSRLDSNRWKIIWRQLLAVLHIWGIVYAVLLAIVIYFTLVTRVGKDIWLLMALVVLPALLLENTIMFGSRFFQMAQKPLPMAINAIASGTTALVVNYTAVVYWDMHYMGFFCGWFAASFVSFLFFIYPVYFQLKFYPIFNFTRRRLIPHLKVALPTIPHNYSSYLLNTSDRILLDTMKTPLSSVGQYNFAYQFGNYVDLSSAAVGTAVSPFYLRLYSKKTEPAYEAVRFLTFGLQILFLAASAILVIWCKELFFLLSANKELAESYPIAILIIMSYTYRPMYWGTINRLGFEEKTQHLWKISLVGGLINVGLNLVLIPYWGIYGTAFSTFIGLMYIGFSGYFLKAFRELEKLNYYPLRWFYSIILTSIFVFLVRDIYWYYKVVLTCMIIGLLTALVIKYKYKLKLLNNCF